MFSVLLSLYYKESPVYLTTALESILKQTLPPTEIRLIVDGPIPDTLQSVLDQYEQKYPDLFRIIYNPENRGIAYTLSMGVRDCQYEYIARMDTDDIAFPDRFEKQMAYMKQHPEIDVLGSQVLIFDHDPKQIIGHRNLPEKHDDIYRFGRLRCPMNHPTVMYRRAAVLSAGNYIEKYKTIAMDDYDLWMRMLVQGHRFHNLPEALLYYRGGNDIIARRRGWDYIHDEMRCFRGGYKLGYIRWYNLLLAFCLRTPVRLLPKSLTRFFYRSIIHK